MTGWCEAVGSVDGRASDRDCGKVTSRRQLGYTTSERGEANKMQKAIDLVRRFGRRPVGSSQSATFRGPWIFALLGLALLQTLSAMTRQSRRSGHLRHRLAGGGRIWRLLSGGRDRHLRETRPRGHHPRGRAAGQSDATADGRPAGLQSRRRPRDRVRAKSSALCRDRRDLSEGPGGADRASRPGQRQFRGAQGQTDRDRRRRAAKLVALPGREIRLQRLLRSDPTPSTWRRSWPTKP